MAFHACLRLLGAMLGHANVIVIRPLKDRLRFISKRLRLRGASREDAEDLVQEAVLRLHLYTQHGGEVRDCDAFITRTAMNLAVDAYRQSRQHLYETAPVEDLPLIDPAPAPDEVFVAEQRLLEYRRALDQVSERTREIFFMHRLQGYSHAEIAGRLGITKSAIEKHIASAVTILALYRARQEQGE